MIRTILTGVLLLIIGYFVYQELGSFPYLYASFGIIYLIFGHLNRNKL